MRASSVTKSVVAACTVLTMLLLGIQAANAADGAPDPATTQPGVTADTSPSPDSVPATPPAAETPSSDAPVATKTDAPAAPQVKTTLVVQTMSTDKQDVKVTICHRSDSATNPYRQITVDQSAVDGVGKNDHYGEHQGPLASTTVVAQQLKDAHTKWGDIIPPLAGVHNGLNWTTEGQAIYNANCVVPTPPVVKACTGSGDLTWTKNANLSEATVTLKKGFTSCDVSLNSYQTEGATWATSGTQVFIDHATVHLTADSPSGTLTVRVQGCFQQQDLYIGTTRFDGTDGALPHYPTSVVPTGLIDHWNGAVDCTPPPPTDVCKNIAGDQTTVPAGFVQNGEDCTPVHNVCTTSAVDASVWTTEDGAPTVGDDGIVFSTPNAGDKVNYFGRTLAIPFAGISGGSYTVKNTGGPITAYDMEVFQTGTSSFATIVFEPYVNGLTGAGTSGDGTFHTYVITDSSLVWNSKIISGEGSQAQPVTLTRMQELIPAATLIRAGLGQGRNNAGSLSTVSNFTDPACGYTVFPKKPVVVAPSATIGSVCAADGTDVTAHLVAGTYDTTFQVLINGDQVGEKSMKAGETFDWTTTLAEDSSGGSATVEVRTGEISLTSVITVSTDCLPPVTVIPTPPAPKVTAPTCTADGSLPPLVDGDGYTAAYNRPFNGPGVYTLTFTVSGENTVFATGKTVSYDLTVGKKLTENCATTTGGANTGLFGTQPGASASNPMDSFMGIGIGGIALAIAALIGLALVNRRKRSNADGTAGVE